MHLFPLNFNSNTLLGVKPAYEDTKTSNIGVFKMQNLLYSYLFTIHSHLISLQAT
jgi:hypothetical protein